MTKVYIPSSRTLGITQKLKLRLAAKRDAKSLSGWGETNKRVEVETGELEHMKAQAKLSIDIAVTGMGKEGGWGELLALNSRYEDALAGLREELEHVRSAEESAMAAFVCGDEDVDEKTLRSRRAKRAGKASSGHRAKAEEYRRICEQLAAEAYDSRRLLTYEAERLGWDAKREAIVNIHYGLPSSYYLAWLSRYLGREVAAEAECALGEYRRSAAEAAMPRLDFTRHRACAL